MDPERVGDLFRFAWGRDLVGRLAVLGGFLSAAQLDLALVAGTDPRPIGTRLVELGYLTPGDLADLERQQEEILRSDGGLPAGRALGHYLLVEELGEGRAGIVWKAWDPRLERWVAVKEAREDAPGSRERFVREARAAAKVRHPHLVEALEVGRDEDRDYIVMTYVDGKPLDQVSLPVHGAVAVMADIAGAVAALHAAGVLHRDIKPQNILLDASGHGWLTDFGIARDRAAPSLTLEGTLLGTPVYMAPEQALGRPDRVGEPADVYGLGSTLYHLVTGRAPFLAEDPLRTLLGRLSEEAPAPPRQLNPQVPEDLDFIIRHALEKDPAGRYPGAAAMAEDLRRFLRGEPPAGRRAGWVVRGARWAVRRPRRLAAALGAALLVALAGVGIRSLRREDRYHAAFQEGTELWMRGAFQSAFERFDLAARTAPNRPEAWLMKGRCFLRLGNAALAEAAWTEALRRDPSFGPALLERGKAVVAAYLGRRPPPAGRVSGGSIRFGSPDPEGTEERERRRKGEEDLARARSARGLDPAELKFLEGALAFGKGSYPEATRALEEYVRKNEWDPAGWSLEGASAYLSGDFERAERCLGRALALQPRPERYRARGDALIGLGRYQEAADAYALAGDDPSARCSRGVALEALGRTAEAIEEYTRALAGRPRFARALNNRGTARASQLDLAGARRDFEEALEANEFYAEAYHNLGNVLLLEDRVAEALRQYDLALGCDPDYLEARVHRARARLRANRIAEAVADFEAALRSDPANPDTALDLATALRAQGSNDRALEILRQALASAPAAWPRRPRAIRLQEEWSR